MAAATGIYKRILQVLEKWPVEHSKAGRDLGPYLLERINRAYADNKFESNYKYWDSQFFAIEHLVNNNSKNLYPRALKSSATGLSAEECHIALSNEFLQKAEEEDKSWFSFKS